METRRVRVGRCGRRERKSEGDEDARDGAVERRGAERDALADVGEHEVALDLALECNLEHAAADVHADPLVALLGEDLAAEAAAGADVEEEARAAQVVEVGLVVLLLVVVVVVVVVAHGGLLCLTRGLGRGRGGGEVEELEAAVGHFCLDRLDARVVGVLVSLAGIVELRARGVGELGGR